MDSWSKEDYSRHVREASMAVEKLPKVNPPSDRVPGRGLLTLPISEALRRRNDGEIRDSGSCGCWNYALEAIVNIVIIIIPVSR